MRSISTSIVTIASFCITGASLAGVWPTPVELNGQASNDEFGYTVAINGDTCVIGAYGTNSYAGSAYVYTHDASGNWSQVDELNGLASNDQFGWSVAIDGDTCVIGATGTNSVAGSAYVYTSDASGNWNQVAELTGQASGDNFGRSIAIDGDICVIGASGANSGTGSAYVYTSDASGNWSQVAALTGQASGDNFGRSVAIDGDTCVIGAYRTDVNGSSSGSAYIYTPDASGNWSQVAEFNGGASNEYFGYSVAIDGDTCMIGAYGINTLTGSAYVYTPDASGNWNQVTELNGEASGDRFGYSIAIDGDTCVIGADKANYNTGGAYVYTSNASGNWSQVAELKPLDGASWDRFGVIVAIDGDACVIGASGTKSETGSAYVYGGNPATGACIADIVVNDYVDIYDLLELLQDWGPCP